MTSLYRMSMGLTEIAALLATPSVSRFHHRGDVHPGDTGIVISQDIVRAMDWGFPSDGLGRTEHRNGLRSTRFNARDDDLDSSFWRESFNRRRCLIPIARWAEAEGERDYPTRTWHALPGGEPFTVGGIWRPTAEDGLTFSMVTTDSSANMAAAHDRMPLILAAADRRCWLKGRPDEASALCQVWEGDLSITQTREPWELPRDGHAAAGT